MIHRSIYIPHISPHYPHIVGWLVVSNMTGLLSISFFWVVILPIDELVFFNMVKTVTLW